ncbi:MAG TPA: multidrug efflux RND transporter permease subunit [Chthoniobacterales bacterium]|nr:multidrug efflux RND transporter permease subunit [Chthoniobacterales bacterium]
MKLSHFFIDRPIFAIVISVVTVLLGCIGFLLLPVAQFPEITPPTIVVTAQYPGADPKTLSEEVAQPIEQQVNGVENMLYMPSESAVDGTMQLTVTFKLGTDPNIAQVLVQNRVEIAQSQLPAEVRNIGITTQKQSPDVLMAIGLTSKSKTYSPLYLSNYAYTQIVDTLKRIDGVGNVQIVGAQPYSMRVWLNSDLMYARGLTPDDVVSAIQAQNIQVAPGNIGGEPAHPRTELQLTLTTKGRLLTSEDFSQIILKRGQDGQLVYLGDVAKLELGGQSYTSTCYRDGVTPSVGILIYQLPGSNQLKMAGLVRKALAEMARSFPPGMEYVLPYDTSSFTQQSIDAVYDTLRDAVILVVIVVMLFLQSWRIAVIPLIAVPVSLIGTLAVMATMGFSLNMLTLFGLVLAIGIVVDDAIVVVENVERWIERGLNPREASRRAMDEVGGAVISVAIVLTAVFVPAALVSGISGQFYRQFALTIVIATLISAFNSLTLSPALAALLIKPGHAKKDLLTRLIEVSLGWFFRLFNRSFDLGISIYGGIVKRLLRISALVLVIFAGLLVLTGFLFEKVPGGFIPNMDQGYLMVFAQLPDGASLQRTHEIEKKVAAIAKVPGVELTFGIEGLSILDNTIKPNCMTMFLPLKPFSERMGHPDQTADAIAAKVRPAFSGIQDAFVVPIIPPAIRGLGNAGGFQLEIEDRRNAGLNALQQATDSIVTAANAEPGLTRVFTTYRSRVPQLYLNIDREKVQTLDVPLNSIFTTLQSYLGTNYVNDFNFLGRTFQVNLQGNPDFRADPSEIQRMYTRSNSGGMVPLGSLLQIQEVTGPDAVGHYNVYPAALIQGDTLPGVSSGQAIEKMERLCRENLPSQFAFEWTQLTYQQVLAGNTAVFVFPLCVLFVFLALAAQYESWSLPLAVILIVPMCLLSAMMGVLIRGQDNNIFTQIGFIVLVGLACKNAILIVEFAKQQIEVGKGRMEAAAEAARLRLRPILMTSFAFILGVTPLVVAAGAGAEMNQALGTAVFAGMIGVTFFGIFLTPVFFSVVMKFFGPKPAGARVSLGTGDKEKEGAGVAE